MSPLLPFHNRHKNLRSGTENRRLKNVIIIILLSNDLFEYDRIVYTVKTQCVEKPHLEYNDSIPVYERKNRNGFTKAKGATPLSRNYHMGKCRQRLLARSTVHGRKNQAEKGGVQFLYENF